MYATTNIASTVVRVVSPAAATFWRWVTIRTTPVTAKPARPAAIVTCRAATVDAAKPGSGTTVFRRPAIAPVGAIATAAATTNPTRAATAGLYTPRNGATRGVPCGAPSRTGMPG